MARRSQVVIPQSLIERRLIPEPSTRTDAGLVRRDGIDYPDKYRGSLLAGAIGDALGRPAEGMPASVVRERFGSLTEFRPWHGWRSGPVGTITDDTQLTMELARVLIAGNGVLDPEHFAERLVAWLPHGRGKGRATTDAVVRLTAGVPWDMAGMRSAGNGAAMRAAPVGLLHPLDIDALRRDAALSAVVTHADPMAVVSTVAQAHAVAYLTHISPGTLDIDDFFRSVDAAISDLHDPGSAERRPGAGPDRVRLADRLADVHDMLDLAPWEAFDRLHNGAFVLESLPAAWWCFLSRPDEPEAILVTAADGGRDADTVAAMAGNLSGAYLGEGAIPDRWLDDLEYADELRTMADEMYALSGLASDG